MALDAWSWSRLETWELCPLKFKLKFIDKVPDAGGPAMERGNVIHKETEHYLTGVRGDPPAAVTHPFQRQFLQECRDIDDKVVEQQWAFDTRWEPTGWFTKGSNAAWLRTKVDYAVLYEDMALEVIDWKTGKPQGYNADQVELFALSAMCHFKPAVQVLTRLVYFDAGTEQRAAFDTKDKPALIAKWNARVAPMFADTHYIARPNDKCRWCAYAKSKGGSCRFG